MTAPGNGSERPQQVLVVGRKSFEGVNLRRLVGTDPQWTYLLIGVLIIAAVAIDQWIRKVSG